MSFPLPSLRGLASRLLSRPTVSSSSSSSSSFSHLAFRSATTPPTAAARTTTTPPPSCLAAAAGVRSLSTTSSVLAPPGAKGGKGGPQKGGRPGDKNAPKRRKKGEVQQRDPKVVNMLRHMAVLSPRRIPPPLRMGRNRYLRHWTIHRAWLLFRRQQRQLREANLMRQYQSMHRACEELRRTAGPGTREEGYLYRVAMEKKGVYGLDSIPIEYARAQTETPARVAWNHDWKAGDAPGKA
ncbi:hypothetical protein VTJ83DRAFT_5099 [Remersonia thermophila]|uniref:Large ribosomal subunit protein mL40 n=1 Tax=Remersonia thermophila TaxID=72144 RepID=A0ABR4DC12_9PEZI